MTAIVITADATRAALGLQQFRLGLEQRQELMEVLGAGQLESIYKTFEEEGPGWLPLNYSSKGWMGKKYSAGHKLEFDSGRMRNSIHWGADGNTITLSTGTDIFYAKWQQLGWSGTQNVHPYSYSRSLGSGRIAITNKLGRRQTVTRKIVGPATVVHVEGFSRTISIPPRPFLVFRPEDPQRIESQVQSFVLQKAHDAGLEAG